ncbi:MAG: hypothetical protein ACPGQS_08250 [Bradymonadia bacterium]
MSQCDNCVKIAPEVRLFSIGRVSIQKCVRCGKVVRAQKCEPAQLNFDQLRVSTPADVQAPAVAKSDMPGIYVVVSNSDVLATLKDELANVSGIEFLIYADVKEAMTTFVRDTRLNRERKLVIFHPSITVKAGTAFIYGIRAVEMGLKRSQVPILVLGSSPSKTIERCITESKNARFVSIGHPKTDVELVKRYLKVIDKLAKH